MASDTLYAGSSFDGKIYSFDLNTGNQDFTYSGHQYNRLISGLYLYNGMLFSVSYDMSYRIWMRNGTFVRSFTISITPVVVSLFAGNLILSHTDGLFAIDLETNASMQIDKSAAWQISSLADTLYVYSQERLIRMFHNTTYSTIHETDSAVVVNAADVNTDFLITGSSDGSVAFYSLETGSLVRRVKPHNSSITHIAASASEFFSCSLDGSVSQWSISAHTRIRTYVYPSIPTALSYSQDYDRLIIGYQDGWIRRFNPQTGQMLGDYLQITGHQIYPITVIYNYGERFYTTLKSI